MSPPSELLPCVELGPAGACAGSVVWLHGLGASGHDFEDVVPLLERPDVRFVFPHAPRRPVTANMGLIMPAWSDVSGLGRDGSENERHVRESAALIEALIAREKQRGVPAERIALAGFSQGAALALFVGMRHPEALAGIMVLSGYEFLGATREAECGEANKATPLLICHGSHDPLVGVERGQGAYETYASGRAAAWHEFPMEHTLCIEEIEVIRDWLRERFAG